MAGQKGRSGRKTKAAELGLQRLLHKCWGKTDRENAVKKLAELASKGHLEAIKLLMAYTYGKPIQRMELPTEDGAIVPITIVEVVRKNGSGAS